MGHRRWYNNITTTFTAVPVAVVTCLLATTAQIITALMAEE